ncbi:hypothetical protein CRUP_008311, partial [Coryphaenoides rupestris]
LDASRPPLPGNHSRVIPSGRYNVTPSNKGLLWLIQEYLAQFALIYGIAQALVISVSVKQSVILGGKLAEDERDTQEMLKEGLNDDHQCEEAHGSSTDTARS